MNFEKEPSDEKLESLLRDIKIPADLKSKLKSIPELESEHHKTSKHETSKQSNWKILTLFVLAALLLISAMIAFQFAGPADGLKPVVQKDGSEAKKKMELENQSQPKISANETNDAEPQIRNELDLLKLQQEKLEAEIHLLEMAKLTAQIENVELNSDSHSDYVSLEQREMESMALALSEQISVPFGGSVEGSKARLATVKDQYPGTQGATIAQTLIDKFDN